MNNFYSLLKIDELIDCLKDKGFDLSKLCEIVFKDAENLPVSIYNLMLAEKIASGNKLQSEILNHNYNFYLNLGKNLFLLKFSDDDEIVSNTEKILHIALDIQNNSPSSNESLTKKSRLDKIKIEKILITGTLINNGFQKIVKLFEIVRGNVVNSKDISEKEEEFLKYFPQQIYSGKKIVKLLNDVLLLMIKSVENSKNLIVITRELKKISTLTNDFINEFKGSVNIDFNETYAISASIIKTGTDVQEIIINLNKDVNEFPLQISKFNEELKTLSVEEEQKEILIKTLQTKINQKIDEEVKSFETDFKKINVSLMRNDLLSYEASKVGSLDEIKKHLDDFINFVIFMDLYEIYVSEIKRRIKISGFEKLYDFFKEKREILKNIIDLQYDVPEKSVTLVSTSSKITDAVISKMKDSGIKNALLLVPLIARDFNLFLTGVLGCDNSVINLSKFCPILGRTKWTCPITFFGDNEIFTRSSIYNSGFLCKSITEINQMLIEHKNINTLHYASNDGDKIEWKYSGKETVFSPPEHYKKTMFNEIKKFGNGEYIQLIRNPSNKKFEILRHNIEEDKGPYIDKDFTFIQFYSEKALKTKNYFSIINNDIISIPYNIDNNEHYEKLMKNIYVKLLDVSKKITAKKIKIVVEFNIFSVSGMIIGIDSSEYREKVFNLRNYIDSQLELMSLGLDLINCEY